MSDLPTLPALPAAETPVTAMRVVGQRVSHHDFVEKVKGSLHYAADWQLPGMLHGRVVRSLVPSARIVSIDTKEALALRGVAAVLTAADVPRNSLVERASGGLGELLVSMPILAADRVRYVGEPVAVVAAATQQIADEAAELVAVEYEELAGLFDMEAALEPGAPLVHDEGNLLVSWHIGRGDVDAALAAADVVIEGSYRTQHVEHAYLEPEAGVGWMDDDVVTVRASTQVIEHATEIAEILDLPANKVRVIAAYMGGGFGGKEDMTVEPFIALLVWKTRRPVRMIWDRQESMLASTKRHPFLMRYRTGARRDGTILAQDVDLLGDAGAYPYLSARILFAGAALSCGPYRVPNVRVRARPVFTNNVPTSAFRGFGAMQVTFGYESQMDRVAAALGMDPAEVRRRNFLCQGDVIPTGETLDTAVAVGETLRRALGALGDRSEPSAPGRLVGRGFACNMQPYGRTIWFRDRASAWLTLQADGSLLIRSGVTDLGAGQAASLCQIASEMLGVPLGDISVYIGDTALTPPAGGTFATRQLYMSGNAVLNAARELRAKIDPVAADLLGCPMGELRYEDGLVRGAGPGGISLGELARACDAQAVDLSCLSTWRAESGTFDPAAGQGASFPDYTYGTHAAEVEVDPETGEVRVLRYVASHDVGRAINPMRVEGQIQGGAMQGLGYALTEEIVLDEGLTASSLFSSYFIPTAMDMPDVEVEIVESGEGKGPLNARGIGEPPVGPAAPAVASAIADATGCRPTRLPMTAERVLALLDEARTTRLGQKGCLMGRTYGGPLIDMTGAVDLHCHPYPDLFPRLADDFDIVRAARDAGMKAIVLKCHHENTVSRAYLVQRVMPGIRVFGGVVLNYYVGGINAAAVEAALRLGGKEVWMPTVDAGYHAEVHGGTGGYDAQAGGRSRAEGIWVTDSDGKLRAEVKEVLELVAQYGAILGTCHLSPREIVSLVREARDAGVEKIVVTHPYFKVPNFDMDALVEVAKLGAMPEFGYCTVSPAWAYAPVERIAESIRRIGASRCLLVSDTGQRHNPLPSEALRVFAQTVFEKGIPQEDVQRMISANQLNLLDADAEFVPTAQDLAWARGLVEDPCAGAG